MSTNGSELTGWARDLDDAGKRIWKNPDHGQKQSRTAGYVAAIIVNVIMMWAFNNALAWGVPLLTGSFVAPLVIFNISFVATIVANVVYLAYDPAWFRHVVDIATCILGLVAMYVLWVVFPFDLPVEALVTVGHIAIVGVAIALTIGIIVNAVQLVIDALR